MEHFAEKGYEILYLLESIDEFVIKVIESYENKKFVSVAGKDAAAVTDEEKADLEQKTKDADEVLQKIKAHLGGKVKEVRLTARLKSAAACLTTDGEISLEMERVLRSMPGSKGFSADRVLELNPSHPAVQKTLALAAADEALADRALALYSAACLNEHLPVEDAASLASRLIKLLS